MPGPGARTFWAKIMRQLAFHGPGGPTLQALQGKDSLRVGATGRSPHRPASFCGSRSKPPGGGPARPMLFTQNPAKGGTRSSNRSFPELSNFKSPPAEPGVYHNEIMSYQITPKCTNCGDCLTVCPLGAISQGDDRPRIDPDLCTDCGTCSDVCPARAIEGAP